MNLIDTKISPYPFRFYETTSVTPTGRAMFPYPNYWHGDYRVDYPIIDNRKAGFRARIDIKPLESYSFDEYDIPELCFQTAPNTTYPCYDKLYGQRGQRCNIRLNNR